MLDLLGNLPEIALVTLPEAHQAGASNRMTRSRRQRRRRDPLSIKTPPDTHLAMHTPRLRLLIEIKNELVNDVERSSREHGQASLR